MAYYYTLDSESYFVRWSVGAPFDGCSKLPDGVDVPEALQTCSCNVRAYKYINRTIIYDSSRADVSELYPPAGGAAGRDGADGISCTHSWDGTTLTVTSASGTSSADLKGEKGDRGETGEKGEKGDKGETGAAGGVSSFNGRTGGVVPQTGDYTAKMVGAAPDGFGLGRVGGNALTSADDINNIKEGGFYSWYASAPANAFGSYMAMTVYGMNVNDLVQVCYPLSYGRYHKIVRHCNSGVWGEWEWDNPPMQIGIEYRTTERYKGKPVYALLADFGANINGASAYYGENVDSIVRGVAHYAAGAIPYPTYNGFEQNAWSAMFQFDLATDPSDGVKKVLARCYAGSDMSGAYSNNTVCIYYTKTTD